MDYEKLIDASSEAKEHTYSPYSKFPVGAALICENGELYKGCNIENAAYTLGICAEKTVLAKALSEGHRKFKAIAISSNLKSDFITPCGGCRQFLAEFGLDWDVYMTKPDKTYMKRTVRELLPLSFEPDSLDKEKGAFHGYPLIAHKRPSCLECIIYHGVVIDPRWYRNYIPLKRT